MSASLSDLLERHARRLQQVSLRELFASDPERDYLIREVAGLHIDASRQRLDAAATAALLELEPLIAEARMRLFAGEEVNSTEHRAALHPALRADSEGTEVATPELRAQFAQQQQRLRTFALQASSRWKFVINIGIGGSDLGPRMLCEALPRTSGAPDVRFISSLDPEEFDATLAGCEASRTLFLVASKTFTTVETQSNFTVAREWLATKGISEQALMEHFAATTAAVDRASEAGISAERIFPFHEGIGGRYSVWSSVGLPVVLHAGWEAFAGLLAGARTMDAHFVDTPAADNAPLLLALLMLWNHSYLGVGSRAVLPYNHRLRTLPRYLQQLQMESLGKCACVDGELRDIAAPVVWGGPANDGAHAFFQQLHQGSQMVAVDAFIARVDPQDERRCLLMAQCLAQLDLLASGRRADEVEAPQADVIHYLHPGDRPSTLFLLDDLQPPRLGALLALFEHVTFAVAVLWRINAFDQFGVEYGKRLAAGVAQGLRDPQAEVPGHTLNALFKRLRNR